MYIYNYLYYFVFYTYTLDKGNKKNFSSSTYQYIKQTIGKTTFRQSSMQSLIIIFQYNNNIGSIEINKYTSKIYQEINNHSIYIEHKFHNL